MHFPFFAKKRRKFQNLCKESEEIMKGKKMKLRKKILKIRVFELI